MMTLLSRTSFRWALYILCVLVSVLLITGSWFTLTRNINRNLLGRNFWTYTDKPFPFTETTDESKSTAIVTTRPFTASLGKVPIESTGSEKIVDHWQPVAVTRDVFVFSAFCEDTFKDRVRILGVLFFKSKAINDLHCIMWHSDVGGNHTVTKAAVEMEGGRYKKPYTTAFFVCPLGGLPVPTSVSLADTPHLNSSLNVLSVNIQKHDSPKYNLTSCVSPIFVSTTRNEHALVEWIETNRVLGVEFFTVYVHNISASDLKILEYYEGIKKVEIVNWTLTEDKVNQTDRPALEDNHYFAQVAALNDCLYRNKGRSKLTMTTDLDEIIVPTAQENYTIMDMINRVPNQGIYSFISAFHPTDNNHTAHPKVNEYDFSVKMIDLFTRSRNIRPLNKMIFKPSAIFSIDVHKPHRTLNNTGVHRVDPMVGFIHHYRSDRYRGKVLEDRTTEKYLDKVLENMNITLTAISNG